jgi:hypothetical protein
MMKTIGLEQLIFRHYVRSALLSILTIEILLLAMYFGINAYIGRQVEATLKGEVQAVMPDLVSQAAGDINANFALCVIGMVPRLRDWWSNRGSNRCRGCG